MFVGARRRVVARGQVLNIKNTRIMPGGDYKAGKKIPPSENSSEGGKSIIFNL